MNIDQQQGRKLLLSFNMRPEAGQDYYQFVLGRYIPIMRSLGFEMSEAWGTAYGNGPDRLIGFVAEDEDTVHTLMDNESWHSLNSELLKFVSEFSFKVIPYRQGFQL
ncbi:MAG: hypothetical protein QNJ45_03760 [Ardenticatenaceae bacterium]|nr:hypothetical protein [Ardenticatenaceae bacterium]